MCLFFLRMTPHSSSGFSTFLLTHGREPCTPSLVLYNAWVGKALSEMSVEQWVITNTECVQAFKDEASANYHAASDKRKQLKDTTSKVREVAESWMVWYRTPSLSQCLQPSWQDPYEVTKVLGGLTYQIDVDGKKIVHLKILKEDVQRMAIKRLTKVLDDDCIVDEVTVTNDKVQLQQVTHTTEMVEDIDSWLKDFTDVVCVEPGLTNWVEWINTGDAPPVAQRPYNTPVSHREAVDKEVDWLLGKGYIQESQSEWVSTIVTVRKPDGSLRLCIDYKKLNSVTTPAPSYMPTIEEILEKAGTAEVISTIDLYKGYYQVQMRKEDVGKTAFVCHKRHFEFVRMPFGLKADHPSS